MKNSQKGFAALLIIIIVVVLLGLYYVVTKYHAYRNINTNADSNETVDLKSYATTTKYKATVKPTGPNGTYTKEDALKEADKYGIAYSSSKKFMDLVGTGTSAIWATPYSLSNVVYLKCPDHFGSYTRIDPEHRFEMSVITGDIVIKSECMGYGMPDPLPL